MSFAHVAVRAILWPVPVAHWTHALSGARQTVRALQPNLY